MSLDLGVQGWGTPLSCCMVAGYQSCVGPFEQVGAPTAFFWNLSCSPLRRG